eukprot:TRINITY_DN16131_c0_g1_i1.p1 TRINITY_DN16131_c0_g1~~TRINITY_DN16131_c0_g1_i1.p1  ORF type:complete len:152 (+),score=26.54 TRINITY_DN16131_c0_g1_i1:78-533(+)
MQEDDIERGQANNRINRQQTEDISREKLLLELTYSLSLQVVYEYYNTFNLFVLGFRLIQMLLVLLGFVFRRLQTPTQPTDTSKRTLMFILLCATLFLFVPVLLFQMTPTVQPILVVIVGPVRTAPMSLVLVNDLIMFFLMYLVLNEQRTRV